MDGGRWHSNGCQRQAHLQRRGDAFLIGFVATLLVAGMMRHVFVQSQPGTVTLGAMGGFGIGAFLITPWVMMNYTFSGRPFKLTLIDGTNSVVGCTLMGIIFGAFGI